MTLINRKNREAGSPEQAQIQPLPEKLITYAIPCYNSAEYMDHCIESILACNCDDIEIIDSFFENAPADARPLWFLGKSLELLATADVAAFARGWRDARGCRIENICAIEYGIDVVEDYSM